MLANPSRVTVDFSNQRLTSRAGLGAFACMAHHLGVHDALRAMTPVRQRQRKVHDSERFWGLVASLGCGHGSLSELDMLAHDRGGCEMIGVTEPDSRRASEHMRRVKPVHLDELQGCARRVAARLIPEVAAHEYETNGCVPVFLDTTQIEVTGKRFEGVERDHDGQLGYQMSAAFIGNVQVSSRLRGANAHSLSGCREQLEADVVPLVKDEGNVWVRADNAYYSGDLVEFFAGLGWGYSISVTSGNSKRPVLTRVEKYLEEEDWTAIGDHEEVALIRHRPAKWRREQTYAVVRRDMLEGREELFPSYSYTVILTSRDDLEPAELVTRHRRKQGQENAFKGPLRDMNLHHPRCASYVANQTYCALALIAQLVLRAMQYLWLPPKARVHSLGYLIKHLIRVTVVAARHPRQLLEKMGRENWRLAWLYELRGKIHHTR